MIFIYYFCKYILIFFCCVNIFLKLSPVVGIIKTRQSWKVRISNNLTSYRFLIECAINSYLTALYILIWLHYRLSFENYYLTAPYILSHSMSNHPDLDTLTSHIFLKLSPVVGIIKTRQSWKFELVTPSGFQDI